MLGSRSCGFSGPDFYKLGDETTREKKWHKSADFGATEASFLVGRILSYTGVYTDICEHGWSWLILGLIWQFYAATTAFTSIYEQSVLQLIQSTRANVSTQTFRVEMVWEWLSHVGLVLKASFFLIIDSPCAQRCGKPFDLFRKFSESPMKNKEGKACWRSVVFFPFGGFSSVLSIPEILDFQWARCHEP